MIDFNRKGAEMLRPLICRSFPLALAIFISLQAGAQNQYELNSGWHCAKATEIKSSGEQISQTNYALNGWLPATVPGTVLTTLLNNKLIPDPFYGMNNKQIPDIYDVGSAYYTYWFVKDFDEAAPAGSDKVWIIFRGINYSCDIYINGRKVNEAPDKGMFLRQSYDVSGFLSHDGHNRLAVIVRPPDPVGNPNGGQGGDGVIARSVTNQYVAGWDWIQPIHDRNTGIWDKVLIKKTKQVNIDNAYVVTSVPGRRMPDGLQKAAGVKVTIEAENTDTADVEGSIICEVEGKKASTKVTLEAHTMQVVELPTIYIDSPRLWWPNGYGDQPLYSMKIKFVLKNKAVADEEQLTFGIRELKYVWNKKTQSREIRVNGQKIFIKGGNYILPDAMLRMGKERYDAEVRMHRDMNLNLLRVWGGGITQRPEFYDACDKYGLLVMQDLWASGDCNGRWYDTTKLDDTLARRKYPDDHELFIESAADQVKMLRSHPSLAIWCGGNEIRPPEDILTVLRDSLLPQLDGKRFFFEYSNHDSMSLNSHDGPYTIQKPSTFWSYKTWPFNSEIGSVGLGDIESLERFIPKQNLVPPYYDAGTQKWIADSVWRYHKYCSYDSCVEAYGHPASAKDFATKAQLVNYDQYRSLIEGFSSHMWDWYTGVMIWKTQNPWTAMVGQMYDVYLDPNACFFGLATGSRPLHVMYDPVRKAVMVANNNFRTAEKLTVTASVIDINGKERMSAEDVCMAAASKAVTVRTLKIPDSLTRAQGAFLWLTLADSADYILDENLYWFPDAKGNYSGLAKMPRATVSVTAQRNDKGSIDVMINNTGASLAFFNRISLVDAKSKERILPVFYNNNYISVLPGQQQSLQINYTPQKDIIAQVCIEGWNVDKKFVELK